MESQSPSAARHQHSSRVRTAGGFTLVEVAMASLILVVGFIGLIQAVTLGVGWRF